MAGRSRYRIVLSDEERVELEHRASRERPRRDVQRAKLMLDAAEGLPNSEIAGRLGVARRWWDAGADASTSSEWRG
jgi:hypothetical protein